jgi:hypothetical protein
MEAISKAMRAGNFIKGGIEGPVPKKKHIRK